MQRAQSAAKSLPRQLLRLHDHQQNFPRINNYKLIRSSSSSPCDVFINHRGIDTKKTIATLLYDKLSSHNLRPFLDNKNMKPGDKLFEKIDGAIHGCKVFVAVFSPNYCDSYFCLHELALVMETKKRVIPIFCDVKPSSLRVEDDGRYTKEEIKRFRWALKEAKYTVGLTFDSSKGNLSKVVTKASDIVIHSLIELEAEKQIRSQNASSTFY